MGILIEGLGSDVELGLNLVRPQWAKSSNNRRSALYQPSGLLRDRFRVGVSNQTYGTAKLLTFHHRRGASEILQTV